MNATLLKSLLALVPTLSLLVASVVLFKRTPSMGSGRQLLGAGCLVVVVLTHVFESLGVLPWMQWGRPRSAGHYLDLLSAILGVTLLPTGYLLRRRPSRRANSACSCPEPSRALSRWPATP